MKVLVDTSVWLLALRRKPPRMTDVENELTELVEEGRVLMLGAIRQELLSGIRSTDHFKKLRDSLRAFPDLQLEVGDYENAAKCCNKCRSAGFQGSNTDFLLCAVAMRANATIFTTDGDFQRFDGVLHFGLHQLR